MSTHPGESLYELALNNLRAAGAGGSGPDLPPPRPSAAVVPWRRAGGSAIEVYWVRRADELSFMGGWHAFPGGGLSRSDAAVPVDGHPAGAGDGPPAAGFPESLGGGAPGDQEDPGPDLLPGLVTCALRELFEETGLLLAAPLPDAAALAEAQRALLAKEKTFAEILAGLGARLDASRLVWAGRWVTPPFAPVRFDNRFFLLEWPASETLQPVVLPGELVEGEWIAPTDALARCQDEALAAPPILHILEVLAGNGPLAPTALITGIGRLRDPSETNLGPLRRIEMRPGVLMFPLTTHTLPPALTTNAYLLGTEESVLVDPGSPLDTENERLERALIVARDRLGRRVTGIWLTHHHPDHIGGVERLRRFLGVPVFAHPATAERLAGRIEVDGTLADDQQIVLAGDPPFAVRVLHTPGHARGHLCFLAESHGSVLAGDLVAGLGTIVVDPPEGDMDDYLASLARLADLDPRTLFPAHGPAIKNAVAKLREYIKHRLWREDRVVTAWSLGLRTPNEMLATVYDDVPKEAHPLAERQILAHLARLRKAGRIE